MSQELTAVEANRRFYEDVAGGYDQTETCICQDSQRQKLRRGLDAALQLLGPDPRVLDACGGSGNASELLLDRGITTTVVDVSPEMTAIWRRKAEARGHEPEIVLAPVEEFLAQDDRRWDLVVFSSALHHIEDHQGVAEAAASRLAPGGVLLTVFDPTRTGRVGKFLRRVDWVLWRLIHDTAAMPPIIASKLRRTVRPGGAEPNVGSRAERYALSGVDDLALAERLRGSGLEVVQHWREFDGRYRMIRGAFALTRSPSSFSMVAMRPSADDSQ